MHWLDTTLLIVLGVAALTGAAIGFLRQIFWILAVSIGGYATLIFREPATKFLELNFLKDASPAVVQVVAPFLLFLTVFLLLWGGLIVLKKAVQFLRLEWLNRFLGSALTTGIAAALAGTFLVALTALPEARPVLRQTTVAAVLANGWQTLREQLPSEVGTVIDGSVQQVGGHLQNGINQLQQGSVQSEGGSNPTPPETPGTQTGSEPLPPGSGTGEQNPTPGEVRVVRE